MQFRFYSIFFLITLPIALFAQLKPFQTNKASQFTYRESAKYNVKYIDVEHGLSSSFIRSICEDDNGNLLLGTWGGGLMKYDGITIDVYNNYSGLPYNTIRSIVKFNNEFRILFDNGDFYSLKNNVFTLLKSSNDSVYYSAQFKVNNQTWLLTGDSTLYLLQNDKSLVNLNNNKNIPRCKIFNVIEKENETWISSSIGLICLQQNNSIKIVNKKTGLPDDKVIGFVFKNNKIIFSTPDGVFQFNEKLNEVQPILFQGNPITNVSKLILDKDENVWMSSTKTGAYRWNGKDFIHLDIENGLTNNEVWSIYCDKFNNVWIGPRAGGLCRFDGDYIKHYDAKDGISGKVVWALAFNKPKNTYYFGTIGGGITLYDGNKFTPASFNAKLPHQSVRSLFVDSKQNLWIGTVNGLACYNAQGVFVNYSKIEQIADETVFNFKEDKNGVIWISHDYGLTCFNDGVFSHPFKTKVFSNAYSPNAVCFTKNNETWVGHNNGVIALNANEEKIHTNFTDSITSVGICLLEDSKKRIWLGTRNGIYVKSNNKNLHITQLDGLSSDIVWSLGEDENGNVWAGTEFGLSKINLVNDSYSIEVIGMAEGFTGGDCTQNGLLIDDKGIFWWGTSKKLTSLDPKKYIRNNKIKPALQLKNILLNYIQTDFVLSEYKEFNHNQNHLTFEVSAIDWGNETKLKYQFQLIGFENKWSPKTLENKITYSNLPPGDYTLKVKAFSNSGLESEELTYSFVISPAFWQTLWFKILIFVVIAVILISFYKYRTYSLVEKRKLLEKVVKERTAEIVLQKELVEVKNKEILDSITYAKRLQEAILPPLKLVQKYLENSFILYKPKDIVAGDFYWFEAKGDLLFFAAADCTGHGVPGAMVSVVCSNALNRTVKEFGITEPGKILDKVRELVVETFERSESDVKDGMDISLCVLDLKKNELNWSGANNPLWIFRRETDKQASQNSNLTTHILIEYKPDKQPIGRYSDEKPFTSHKINLEIGDTLFIFTDGYSDQFGGEKGKKYKSTKMKELFLSIQDQEMDEQRKLIDDSFENWRGNLEQIDDVCVIGIRI
ncbi:MAG: two-component regulator propeller domain-containing protein [Bacteroidota bacterium]